MTFKMLFFTFASMSQYIIAMHSEEHPPCVSNQDLIDYHSESNVDFFEMACNERHDEISMSCFSWKYGKAQSSACGLKASSSVTRHLADKSDVLTLACACDALCRFYGDCCYDFATACPADVELAEKFAQVDMASILNGTKPNFQVMIL